MTGDQRGGVGRKSKAASSETAGGNRLLPPKTTTHRATLREAVDEAIAAMPWLRDSDGAAIELARVYADRIDYSLENESGQDVTKALYLGPHLLNTLRAVGGTPAERKLLADGETVGGKLAKLRAIHGGNAG